MEPRAFHRLGKLLLLSSIPALLFHFISFHLDLSLTKLPKETWNSQPLPLPLAWLCLFLITTSRLWGETSWSALLWWLMMLRFVCELIVLQVSCAYFLKKSLFKSLAHFLIELFVFLFLSCKSYLSSECKTLSNIWFTNIPLCELLFTVLESFKYKSFSF